MRCLMIVPSLRRAGAETQVVALANGLAGRDHEVHLLTFERHLDQRDRLVPAVRHHATQRRWKYDFGYTREIARIIDEEGIEVVHATLQFALLAAWLGRLQARRTPPLVASLHTTISRDRKEERQVRWLYRQILRHCPSIVFVSENQRAYWIRHFPELTPLSAVVHNGVPIHRYELDEWIDAGRRLRDELGIPEAATVFGCLAAFRPEKAHHLLVDAFTCLDGKPHLLLAGDGPLRDETEASVREKGLDRRVHFLGEVDDVRPVIAASTVTVLSSVAVETFSMAMLESMAMGVPMIAPAIGGLPEAIEDGETGLLFPPGDAAALEQSMACIIEDHTQAKAMGSRARSVVCESFTEELMIQRTEAILKELAQRSREGATSA